MTPFAARDPLNPPSAMSCNQFGTMLPGPEGAQGLVADKGGHAPRSSRTAAFLSILDGASVTKFLCARPPARFNDAIVTDVTMRSFGMA
jgi:hypothetical protein